MTKTEFKKLKLGDVVKHKQHSMTFTVTDNQKEFVVAVATVVMLVPEQWERVKEKKRD